MHSNFKMINVDLGIKLQHDTFNRGDCGGEKYNWLGKTILLLHSSIFMNASHIITCIDSITWTIPDVPVNQVLLPIKSDIKCSVFPCEHLHGCDCQNRLYQWRRMAFSSDTPESELFIPVMLSTSPPAKQDSFLLISHAILMVKATCWSLLGLIWPQRG